MKKLSKAYIAKQILFLSHKRCKLIDKAPYRNARQKLLIMDLVTKKPFKEAWYVFKNRPRSPYWYKELNIGRHRKWNTKSVAQYIKTHNKGHYRWIRKPEETYHNTKTKLTIKHLMCGRTFQMDFEHYKRGEKCPYDRFNLTKAEVKSKINHYKHGQFKLMLKGPYKNYFQELPILCTKCNNVFHARLNDFSKTQNCPYCGHNPHRKLTKGKVAKRIKALGGGQYKLMPIKHYTGEYMKLPILHKKCGHVSYISWNDFQHNGERCQFCNIASKGERTVRTQLIKHHIKYIHGYLTNCYMSKHSKELNKPLHLDFYLPKYRVGIEYDGIQHQKATKHFGGLKNYETQHARDQKKNLWCKKHHIKLIRITSTARDFQRRDKLDTIHQINKKLLPLIRK